MQLNFFKKRAKDPNKEPREKMDKEHSVILIVCCVFFSIYAFILIFPYVWLFINSLKTKQEFILDPWALPKVPLFSNYGAVLGTSYGVPEMLMNSFILCIAIPTVSAFSTSCMGYALARHKFRGNSFFYLLAISVMFISIEGGLASQYKLMYDLHLIDTYFGVIIKAASGFGFNFLLMYGIFQGIPYEYNESAEIDGAGNWRIFLQIIAPQALPTIMAIWVLSFIGVWNDYGTPYLYLQAHPTISLGLKEISDQVQVNKDYPSLFAIILATTAPMIILFLCFQDKLMTLTVGGGIKG